MTNDSLVFHAIDWLLPATIVGCMLAMLVVWSYFRGSPSAGWRSLCGVLKVLAVGGIVVCLLEPMRRGERPRPQANVVAILADNSQSMRMAPTGDAQPRHERIRELLNPENAWFKRLAQDFDTRHYAFDSGLQSLDSPASLEFQGRASSLRTSLETLATRLRSRPVAGVLLFSDGNSTDGDASDWSKLGVPIFPVVEPESDAPRDLRLTQVAVSQSDFEAAPVAVTARLQGDLGFESQVLVRILDASGKILEEQRVAAPRQGRETNLSFRFRPEKSGVQFFRVVALHADDDANFSAGTSVYEATLANNTHEFVVDRGRGPYRVLYVAGRPNWEFKFLRRAIQEDPELNIVGLLRIAKKAPKFSFRDRGVDDTNPLFAGLGKGEQEAAQQHDEPVLVRLGIDNEEELRSGFPKEAKELFAYHAVIIDDLEGDFFSEDQKLLLRRFVNARGGGLLLLGGQESLNGDHDSETPLGELAPVYLRSSPGDQPHEPVKLELTREGLLQPWMRLRTTQQQELQRMESMPTFQTVNVVGQAKPGASILATGRGANGESIPLVVAQRFGLGRSAVVTVGDFWRWSMHRQPDQPNDLPQAWRQLVRYLVTDAVPRVSMRVLQSPDSSRPTLLEVVARNEEFQPMDNVALELKVSGPNGKTFTVTPDPDEKRGGTFRAECWSRESGSYLAELTARSEDGSEVGRAETGWTAQPAAAEFQRLETNRESLATLARQTGGELILESDLQRFVENWPAEKVPVRETWEYPLWHRPWVLLLAIGLLCSEWGIRRWKGLP